MSQIKTASKWALQTALTYAKWTAGMRSMVVVVLVVSSGGSSDGGDSSGDASSDVGSDEASVDGFDVPYETDTEDEEASEGER